MKSEQMNLDPKFTEIKVSLNWRKEKKVRKKNVKLINKHKKIRILSKFVLMSVPLSLKILFYTHTLDTRNEFNNLQFETSVEPFTSNSS